MREGKFVSFVRSGAGSSGDFVSELGFWSSLR